MSYWSRAASHRLARRRVLIGLGTTAAGAAFLMACGGGSDKGSSGQTKDASGLLSPTTDETKNAKRGGVYKGSLNSDLLSFEPQSLAGASTLTFTVYSGLMRQKDGLLEQPKGEIEGDVAQSWELSPDKLTLTAKLNPNAKFSPVAPVNGRAVDANDVVFSWQRFRGISNKRGEFASEINPNAPITSMTALDDRTVQIKLAYPYSPILGLLGVNFLGTFFIVPKEAADKNTLDILKTPVGTGPWYMANYTPSVSVTFKKNPGYKQVEGDMPYFDEMSMPIVPEIATANAQFRAGNIYWYNVPASDIVQAKRDIPELRLTQTGFSTPLWHVFFGNQGDSTWKDERVRQAYVLTWDRDAFLDTFFNISNYQQAGLTVDTAYESGLQADHWRNWFTDAKDEKTFGPNAKFFKKDIGMSKQLLSAAGYPNGISATMHYPEPAIQPIWARYNEVVTNMVTESGLFKLARQAHNFIQDFTPNFQSGKANFQGVAHYFAAQQADPTLYLYAFYHPGGGQVQQTDSTMEDMINRSLKEFDTEKRRQLTIDIQKYEGQKQFFPRMAGATGYNVSWPVVRNINVFRSTYQDYRRWFLDETQAPVKKESR